MNYEVVIADDFDSYEREFCVTFNVEKSDLDMFVELAIDYGKYIVIRSGEKNEKI